MAAFNTKRMVKTTAVLILLAAVVGGGKAGYDYLVVNGPLISEARQLDTRIEAAKKLGLPINPEDIDTADRKKKIELHKQFMAFDEFLADKRTLIDDERDITKLCELMYKNPDQIKNLVAASEMPNVDTPIDWNAGLQTHPADYIPYQRYTDVACKLARYNMAKGDTSEAVRFLQAAAKLTTHLEDEPSSAAMVSWTSCANRVLRTAYGFVKDDPRDPDLLAGVKTAVQTVNPPKSLELPIKGDCLMFMVTAKRFDGLTEDKQRALQLADDSKHIDPPKGRFAAPAVESRSLSFFIDSMKLAKPEDGNVQSAGWVIDDLGAQWVLEGGPEDYLSGALPMTYEQTGTGIMRAAQQRNLVMSVIGILSIWQKSGVLPNELPKDDPFRNDPLTGRPLVYKPENGKFVLQAIGEVEESKAEKPVGDLRLVLNQGYGLTFAVPQS